MPANMRRIFGLWIAILIVCLGSSEAFARDPKQTQVLKIPAAQGTAAQQGTVTSTDLGFAPDGFARDVVNLMTGIRHPLDESTSLTFQAGKVLKFGVTF
jgi:hypothetical protein